MSNAVIEIVTSRIIESLKAGVKPWQKEWKGSPQAAIFPRNLKSKKQYSGFNMAALYFEGIAKGYKSPYWLTVKQSNELGGHIRKGEKGTPILWAKSGGIEMLCDKCEHQFPIPGKKTAGAPQCPKCKSKSLSMTQGRFAWRFYLVFNLDQVEGIECPQAGSKAENIIQLPAKPSEFLKKTGAAIRHGGDRAYYSPSLDFIQLPKPQDFTSVNAYYATALHEVGHWTGHEARLARDFSGRFGESSYAFEELIAELTSAYTCAHLGIDSNLENHASYLASWLKILTEKPGALIEACSKASKAFDYLLELTGSAQTEKEDQPEAQLTLNFNREVAA